MLRAAVSALKGTYKIKGHRLIDDVDIALGKIKTWKKYIRPALKSDRLYKSDTIHPLHSSSSYDVAYGTDEALLVVRDVRDKEDDDPAIYYRLIASVNQLMKDACIRDKLVDDKGVLYFEIEAAGLMNHFLCLVIRGIYDYLDLYKNKE